jgi:phage shock protein PspC (stress-responsive transcriptional regulator)
MYDLAQAIALPFCQMTGTLARSNHHLGSFGTEIMAVEGFFEALGEAVGSVIRFIVEGLSCFFGMLGGAVSGFIAGVSKALGVTPSLLSILVLLFGLWLLYLAVRAFIRRSIIAGMIWLVLGLWLLSGLIS